MKRLYIVKRGLKLFAAIIIVIIMLCQKNLAFEISHCLEKCIAVFLTNFANHIDVWTCALNEILGELDWNLPVNENTVGNI